MTRDHLAQRTLAFGRAVLQGLRAMLGQHSLAGIPEPIDRKEVRAGKPAGKRDDVRSRGELISLGNNRLHQ
jgi:hypothetical protein